MDLKQVTIYTTSCKPESDSQSTISAKRDNDRFVRAHIRTKNFSPETECRLMRSLTETGGESGGDLRRTPQQNLLQNRKEKKRKS